MKNLMKLGSILLVTVICLTGCQSSGGKVEKEDSKEKQQVIRVGTDGETPGWSQIEGEELTGFDIDMWKEIGKRLGYEVEFTHIQFDSLFGLIKNDKIDVIANQISSTPEREAEYNLSKPYAYTPIALVGNSNSTVKSLDDLDGKTVAVEPASNDSVIVDAVEKEYGIKLKRKWYDGISINEVALGRVDLWVKSETGAKIVIDEIGKDKLKIIGRTPITEEDVYLFSKTDKGENLRDKVDNVLKDMIEDGTTDKISQKHFGLNLSSKPE